jgi:hypothetical protein
MHVISSGDPVEITGERDSFNISCDISECSHATTHTLDVPMRNVQPRKEGFIHCRDFHQHGLRRGGRLSGGSKLAHEFVNFCMTV